MEYVPRPWLKEAARAVIATLQTISQLREANVIIIGGFALQTHINDRKTKDVDILNFGRDLPPIRSLLVGLSPENFEERSQPLLFRGIENEFVQVDIIPRDLPPYLPANATTLSEVDLDDLPVLGLLDLLVYKIHCCSMRPWRNQRYQDAKDAQGLVNMLRQGPITLDYTQRQAVLSGLEGMLEHSKENREWWESVLALNS